DRPETYTRASGEVLGHALDRDPLRFAHRGSLCLTSSRGTDAMSDRVYSCRGSLNTECTSPTSTTSPAFITATRSSSWAWTPMSWVMTSIVMPCVADRSARFWMMMRWMV